MKMDLVAVIATATTVVEAGIALAVSFGLNLTANQVGLVMAVVAGVGNLILALVVQRSYQVRPVANA